MEKKKIKKKLTISISSKKTHNVPHYAQNRQKTSVVIEKKAARKWREPGSANKKPNMSVINPGVTSNMPATTSMSPSTNSLPGISLRCIFACAVCKVFIPSRLTKYAPINADKITSPTVFQPPIMSPTCTNSAISTIGRMAKSKNKTRKTLPLSNVS